MGIEVILDDDKDKLRNEMARRDAATVDRHNTFKLGRTGHRMGNPSSLRGTGAPFLSTNKAVAKEADESTGLNAQTSLRTNLSVPSLAQSGAAKDDDDGRGLNAAEK